LVSAASQADLLQQLLAEQAEIRAAMVHGRVVHGAQHAVGHVGRPGDLQEMAAGGGLGLEIGHGAVPRVVPLHGAGWAVVPMSSACAIHQEYPFVDDTRAA
jgi:hypothetical protein